jgi:CTP synthase
MVRDKKFIFVTGGVLSSLGKGLSAAALGTLLEARNLRVINVKMDPYINVDPGTMSPYQHGEVFVTDDGAETDLDLGHYERFTSVRASKRSNFTTGRIYQNVLTREREGSYLGQTVQVIPHITDEIKRNIWAAVEDCDIGIIEVGGTVGDIESLPFLEAIRQMRIDAGEENVLYLHLTLVPLLSTSGELKTKPTQHSVQKLREIGIQPNMLICRSEVTLPEDIRSKIALFCNVRKEHVISAPDVGNIYELPLVFFDQQLDTQLLDILKIWTGKANLGPWRGMLKRWKDASTQLTIAIVGKYVHLTDTYKSLNEALHHAGIPLDCSVKLKYVDSETLCEANQVEHLSDVDGILVPGGFGERGVEGKICAIRYARENQMPFFGICLGMQLAVIEYARTVVGWKDANSREFNDKSKHLVIDLMDEQRNVTDKGGTMRLGAYPCVLSEGSKAQQVYGATEISERHRHRYEVSSKWAEQLMAGGLTISGRSPDGKLVEMVELPAEVHPYFVACQFHPEFKSRPLDPHPLFVGFLQGAKNRHQS